ncbi:MAG: mitomycin resistance protein [Elusimicrobia bacterium]|nr:mitomycin resistance protein [Elusimicrobiota bacterium]
MPNVGAATAADFRLLGLKVPADLRGRDPWKLYRALCRKTRSRQDPCVLDTFMAAVAFAENGDRRPWWEFTAERKARYGAALAKK